MVVKELKRFKTFKNNWPLFQITALTFTKRHVRAVDVSWIQWIKLPKVSNYVLHCGRPLLSVLMPHHYICLRQILSVFMNIGESLS